MATVKFITKGKNENVSIYVRFVVSKSKDFTRKTGLLIDASKWSVKKGQPIDNKDQPTKELKSKLDKLAVFIKDAYKIDVASIATNCMIGIAVIIIAHFAIKG